MGTDSDSDSDSDMILFDMNTYVHKYFKLNIVDKVLYKQEFVRN